MTEEHPQDSNRTTDDDRGPMDDDPGRPQPSPVRPEPTQPTTDNAWPDPVGPEPTQPTTDNAWPDPVGPEPTHPATDDVAVDAVGLRCPLPIIRLAAAAKSAPAGTVITLTSTDPAAEPDVAAWCRMRGQTLLGQTWTGLAPDRILTSRIRVTP